MTGPYPQEEPRHLTDWGHVARLERELFGQTYHHQAPGCDCDECMERRRQWDIHLHAENAYGFSLSEHHASLSP